MHDKQICCSFLNTFIPNVEIVDIDYLDSHLRPFKEYQVVRDFINDEKSKNVVKRVNGIVAKQEEEPKDDDFSIFFNGKNNKKMNVINGGWFIRRLSSVYGDLLKTFPKAERDSQVDLLCRIDDSYYALVEIQVVPQDYWDRRALAYAANVYGRQLKEGDVWKKIRKVICINILGGGPHNEIWPEKTEGFSRFTFKDQNNKEIEGGIEVLQYPLFHEATKHVADERGQKKNAYLEWLDLLEHASAKCEKDVEKVSTAEVRRAYETIKSSNLPKEVMLANQQQDAEFFERYSQHIEYREQQAEAKGKTERNIEIAKKMQEMSMDRHIIFKVTGLYPEEPGKPQNTSE